MRNLALGVEIVELRSSLIVVMLAVDVLASCGSHNQSPPMVSQIHYRFAFCGH